ncbi:MAG: glucan biosynthesis protein [Candidatus Saelkia tenebricola]|nr:glucan biosynthesis protein [Candidatus Saelkia tenebricola]
MRLLCLVFSVIVSLSPHSSFAFTDEMVLWDEYSPGRDILPEITTQAPISFPPAEKDQAPLTVEQIFEQSVQLPQELKGAFYNELDIISQGAWEDKSRENPFFRAIFTTQERNLNFHVLQLSYDISFGGYGGYYLKLPKQDLSEVGELSFYVKGDSEEGFTESFKIEFKNPDSQEIGQYVVAGVTDEWQRVTIDLNEVEKISDWSSIDEIVIVLDKSVITEKQGRLYFDGFSYREHDKDIQPLANFLSLFNSLPESNKAEIVEKLGFNLEDAEEIFNSLGKRMNAVVSNSAAAVLEEMFGYFGLNSDKSTVVSVLALANVLEGNVDVEGAYEPSLGSLIEAARLNGLGLYPVEVNTLSELESLHNNNIAPFIVCTGQGNYIFNKPQGIWLEDGFDFKYYQDIILNEPFFVLLAYKNPCFKILDTADLSDLPNYSESSLSDIQQRARQLAEEPFNLAPIAPVPAVDPTIYPSCIADEGVLTDVFSINISDFENILYYPKDYKELSSMTLVLNKNLTGSDRGALGIKKISYQSPDGEQRIIADFSKGEFSPWRISTDGAVSFEDEEGFLKISYDFTHSLNGWLDIDLYGEEIEEGGRLIFDFCDVGEEVTPGAVKIELKSDAVVGINYYRSTRVTGEKVHSDDVWWVEALPRAALWREPLSTAIFDQDEYSYIGVPFNIDEYYYGYRIDYDEVPEEAQYISALNIGHITHDGGSWPQMMFMGGAGYMRFTAEPPLFLGASFRVATHNITWNTENGDSRNEDFPQVKEAHLRYVSDEQMNLVLLIDCEAFSGVLDMDIFPGEETKIKTRANFYIRRDINIEEEPYTGFAGFSSMFWKDETHSIGNIRDEAHDSDFIEVGYSDGTIVAKPIENPSDIFTQVTDFGLPDKEISYFCLQNRDRNLGHYSNYWDAHYDDRVSFDFYIRETNIPLKVMLHEIATWDEYGDNIVVNLALGCSLKKGDEVVIEYEMDVYGYPAIEDE